MEIGSVLNEEKGAVVQLLNESGLPTTDVNEPGVKLFCIINQGEVIVSGGYQLLGNYALIRSLAVKERFKGKYLGELMLKYLLDECSERSVKKVFLLTTTAEAYFVKHGFSTVDCDEVPEIIKQTSEFSSLCPATAIVLTKEIGTYL